MSLIAELTALGAVAGPIGKGTDTGVVSEEVDSDSSPEPLAAPGFSTA
jgi:hypothetical protein